MLIYARCLSNSIQLERGAIMSNGLVVKLYWVNGGVEQVEASGMCVENSLLQLTTSEGKYQYFPLSNLKKISAAAICMETK